MNLTKETNVLEEWVLFQPRRLTMQWILTVHTGGVGGGEQIELFWKIVVQYVRKKRNLKPEMLSVPSREKVQSKGIMFLHNSHPSFPVPDVVE
jgi:hypothetical protein